MTDLTPQTIVDQPVPLIDGSQTDATGTDTTPATTTTVVVPTTQVDVPFPQKIVAQETISQSLNTETKRILAGYSFEQNGAISVGVYEYGKSGEVKISPDGIVAKNVNGDTTFALDGTTGDATFRGKVQAAGFDIIDETGLVSELNFQSDIKIDDTGYTFTDETPTLLASSEMTITVSRPVRIFYSLDVVTYQEAVNAAADASGLPTFFVKLNNDLTTNVGVIFQSLYTAATGIKENMAPSSRTAVSTMLLTAGTNTISVWYEIASRNNLQCTLSYVNFSYISLGS
jgi:hypothetical protein